MTTLRFRQAGLEEQLPAHAIVTAGEAIVLAAEAIAEERHFHASPHVNGSYAVRVRDLKWLEKTLAKLRDDKGVA